MVTTKKIKSWANEFIGISVVIVGASLIVNDELFFSGYSRIVSGILLICAGLILIIHERSS